MSDGDGDMEIWELPDEILSQILMFVPGGALLRARQVCSRWYNVISDIVKKPVTWKERCFAEIPEDILLDLCASCDLKKLAKGCAMCGGFVGADAADRCCLEGPMYLLNSCAIQEEPCAWLKIYMVWWLSRNIGFGKELRTVFTNDLTMGAGLAYITLIKFNGDFLVSATNIGTVVIWNHLTGECVANFLANYYNIVDLKLMPLQEYGINSLPRERLGYFIATTRLVTAGKDRSISIYDLSPNNLSNSLYWKNSSSTRIVGVGYWGNRLVGTSAEILFAGHKVLDPSKKQVDFYLDGYRALPQCMDVWKNKVLSGTTSGELLRWDLDNAPERDKDDDIIPLIEAEVVAKLHEVIIKVIYRPPVIVCIKSNGMLYTSTNDGKTFREINTMEALSGSAKFITLKGTIFALCTSGGLVFLYHIEDYQHFETLDLSTYKTCIHTGAETVFDVDIGDDGDGPMVAIATNESTICYRWFRDCGS